MTECEPALIPKAFARAFREVYEKKPGLTVDEDALEAIAKEANGRPKPRCVAVSLVLDGAMDVFRCPPGIAPPGLGSLSDLTDLVAKCFSEDVEAAKYEELAFPGLSTSCYEGLDGAVKRLEGNGYGFGKRRWGLRRRLPPGKISPDLFYEAFVRYSRTKAHAFFEPDAKRFREAAEEANNERRPRVWLLDFLKREARTKIGEVVPNCVCKFSCDCPGAVGDRNPYLSKRIEGPVRESGMTGCKCERRCMCPNRGYTTQNFVGFLDEVAGYAETGDWVVDAARYDEVAFGSGNSAYLREALKRLSDKGFEPPPDP